MKVFILLVLLATFSNSYAFSPQDILPDNATMQSSEHDTLTMQQEGGKNNHQAANTKEATGTEITIQKAKMHKELKLSQNKAKNSVQCVNAYYTSGKNKGGVYQAVDAKNATYIQKGGSGNIQAGNCIFSKNR